MSHAAHRPPTSRLAIALAIAAALFGSCTGTVTPTVPAPGEPHRSPVATQAAPVGPATPPATPLAPGPPPVVRRVIGGPRPTVDELVRDYQYGEAPFVVDPRAALTDWRLSRPDQRAVAGYAGQVSVLPGGSVDLHLRSSAGPVRLDVFRVGIRDATYLLSVPSVPAAWHPDAAPDGRTGRVEEDWPVSWVLPIPGSWRSGVYLVKLTALGSGAQSYVTFVVRTPAPAPFEVVIPALTYAAYNGWGGSDLYGWYHGPEPRASEASFDRPYEHGYGAGMLFRLDFPLLVWLEDHGYEPAYLTDWDVAHDPSLVTGARTVVLSGHGEYWTASIRDAFDAAAAAGHIGILGMGANMAYWQARLRPSRSGRPDRVVECWKDARRDPEAAANPQLATIEFQSLPIPRPPADLLGERYGGIVDSLAPMVLGPDIARFSPQSGLKPGQRLPGLIGDEVDDVSSQPGALILASTPVTPQGLAPASAGASAWVTPSGAHVFDAGTFDWSWGLDPRYAAALPGFPADSFGRLMADVLAWAGESGFPG